ncbi:oxidoreductase-like domain-containing protein [Neptuniibacter sp. QD48_11]|uniref:oxidoreductase-like domain-containing protein n=1 Tax=unclassified Neptuniibacter TaxID=2630693 RepID=UPI0039F61DDF
MSSKEKPIPPGDFECCESGCSQCVWDIYFDELDQWKAEQKPKKPNEAQGSYEKRGTESQDRR